MANVITKIEGRRGCGYRGKGGTYLVADGRGTTCFKLPIELTVCPYCGSGIKFSREFTWITPQLFNDAKCDNHEMGRGHLCIGCPLNHRDEKRRLGLMWVGNKFYTPAEFTAEAARQGISKRIAHIPREFEVGKTWILLAHIEAVKKQVVHKPFPEVEIDAIEYAPGIFHAFCPQRIEYVVTGLETETELNAMEARGLTLVNVIRDIDAQKQLEL